MAKINVSEPVPEKEEKPAGLPEKFATDDKSKEIVGKKMKEEAEKQKAEDKGFVEKIFAEKVKPVQTLMTEGQMAETVIESTGKNFRIMILPYKDKEIYDVNIQSEDGKLEFASSQTGAFNSKLPLPEGKFKLIVKTQRDNMPFSIITSS